MSMREAFHIDEDDLIQYALGSLKETQLGTMSAHLSLCNQCRDALARVFVDLAAYGAAQPLSDIPAGSRERFLSKLSGAAAGESKFVQMRNKSRLYVASKSFKTWLETPVPLMVLSGVLAAALAFVAFDDLNHIHQLRQTGPALSRLEKDAAELAELKSFLKGSNVQQVSLHEKPAVNRAPEGHALYSATSGRLVFTASNVPALPSGKAYELWILPAAKGAPIPAGTFKPDLQGNAAVVFPDIPSDVQAGGFGVTIEREEGSPTPTMPIVMSGQ